mmetsp:Transcript_19145/g.35733  ORF Transcript_19145/g.35733 Transcript_19145/m.35733 type:complete len:85 (-) Transcript_19145:102-356(-)|eukprot:CAMPEP_0178735812 /NCGR_PEP_ID=MMETSP0744-20121128/2095_1 /TAXON_ID=913974 /ORGANISM="Nitzschia punctata, Strain CCMP561" /LENGTH=84 /DNA_ID=CAMNT_0020388221 /DNA_START=390 /DNA_END=644 /DNA_ORIENTATION=+
MGDGKDEPTSSDGRPPWIVDNWSGIRGVALVPLDSSLPVSTHQDFGSNKTKSSLQEKKGIGNVKSMAKLSNRRAPSTMAEGGYK